MSNFDIASSSEWIVSSTVKPSRRARLLGTSPYEQVVIDLLASCTSVSFPKRPKNDPVGERAVATLGVDPVLLDQFFNGRAGYRAQYYAKPDVAHAADRLVIEGAMPFVFQAYAKHGLSSEQADFLVASFRHPCAKVWPYQGLWLHQARIAERVLLVERWQLELNSESPERRRLARWGSLAPANECRLQLKGGYILGGVLALEGKPQAKRARDVYDLGFT